VPEILVDGVTGCLGRSVDELVAAARRVQSLDRRACRADVEARFSVARMADAYEAVYRAVIDGARRRPSAA
jgi:glycosyltransferase involved in cell wall biosynthesis